MFERKTFSKSSYLIYKQCPKYFWYYINERKSIPEHDQRAQFNFILGHIVGELAKKCFPDGIEVGYENDYLKNLEKTKTLLYERKPLFEAGILYSNELYDVYSRADILLPFGSDAWDIIEVKCSTSVKDINLCDVAFQKYCYENAGLKINKCYLMYINNQYERNYKIDINQLFIINDITTETEKICLHIKNDLKQMIKIASDEDFIYTDSQKDPEDRVGKFCDSPFNCPLKQKCWENVSKDSIYYLYSINKKIINKLLEKNIKYITDIPSSFNGINNKQKIQIECVKNSKSYIDKKSIGEFLKKIKFPIYFLDFETFSSPIPIIQSTRPYQNIPFQFSIHILTEPDSELLHFSYIASGKDDPRKELISNLKERFGFTTQNEPLTEFTGSVIVYNESFEKSVLKDLIIFDPSSKDWIEAIILKIVDLYEPFRNFYYYNKKQNGSASVKKVLPAMTYKSYENLEIANGDIASISFLEKSFLWKNFLAECGLDEKIKKIKNFYLIEQESESGEKTIEKLRENLHNYCKLDTEGMVDIYKELVRIVGLNYLNY